MSSPVYTGTPVTEEAKIILLKLLNDIEAPDGVKDHATQASFTGAPHPMLPLPHKHFPAVAALQALHGSYGAHIWSIRTGRDDPVQLTVDTDHALFYLASAMLARVDGVPAALVKQPLLELKTNDPLSLLPAKHAASAIFRCTDGVYFHTHGSINPRITLAAMGINPDDDNLDLPTTRRLMEAFVETRSSKEMLEWKVKLGLPGDICYKPEEYAQTTHGKIATKWPLFTTPAQLEDVTPPVAFTKSPDLKRPLDGIKVLEMTRVIAGPAIGRQLAEMGATIVRVIAPHLMDFGGHVMQVDLNLGKRACYVDLKSAEGRLVMLHLLKEADVFLHGYRPGVLSRLGFGPEVLNQIAVNRGRGFVQVVENCYGHEGPWAWRPGFQQIADATTGVAWETGVACGQATPITPCLPISDYQTGIIGSI
ncbi:CoA-transferase family III [Punctularia strigosozonata HHB-11173 SS5]|uniref:CoA-transferase family III n=1 Tax=Punctularia strigosozonata (strain HHB-11173) TaxID=741275 RepID=UPI00044162DD|nr:CoA-transferase family III [Punctularia strigosozonata HHB-11173 SS5]EIN07989.1 CoA-transferase family III [Punctularia strigosozonata HHB-11173 SS5]